MPKWQHKWYSADEKMDIIQNYLATNKNAKAFFFLLGVCKSTLYKWLKIYDEAKSSTENVMTSRFQDVTTIVKKDAKLQTTSTMRLIISNNMILEFDSRELHNVLMELKW